MRLSRTIPPKRPPALVRAFRLSAAPLGFLKSITSSRIPTPSHLQRSDLFAASDATHLQDARRNSDIFGGQHPKTGGGVTQKSFSWRMLILKDLTSMTKKGMEPVQVPSKQPSIPPRSSPRSPALMPPRARAPKHSRNRSQSWQKMPSRKL